MSKWVKIEDVRKAFEVGTKCPDCKYRKGTFECEMYCNETGITRGNACMRVDMLEGTAKEFHDSDSAEVAPVVHGNWVKEVDVMPLEYTGRYVCSICDHLSPNGYIWINGRRRCPYCGAMMDEH